MGLKDFRRSRAASRARKRAAQSSTYDLVGWVDVAVMDIASKVRRGDPGDLEEARQSAEALWCIVDELCSRKS